MRNVVRCSAQIAVRLLAIATLAYGGAALFFSEIEATRLWAQTDTVPTLVLLAVSVAFSVCVLVGPRLWAAGYRAARPLAVVLAIACVADAMVWLRLVGGGRVQSAFPVPIGLLTGALLLVWLHTARATPIPASVRTQRDMWNKVLDRAYP